MNKNYLWIVYFLMLVFTLNSAMATTNYISNLDITRGEMTSGTIENTKVFNGEFIKIQEVTGEEGLNFTIDVYFLGTPEELIINARYLGGASHNVQMFIFNQITQEYDLIETYSNSPNFDLNYINITPYVYEGELNLWFYHIATGIDTHSFDIEYLIVTSDYEEPIISEMDLFNIDLTDTFSIILLSILLIGGFLSAWFVSGLLGGGIISLIGLLLLFNSFILLGFIIVIIGFLSIVYDK